MLNTAGYKRSLFFVIGLALIVNALLLLYVVKQTESVSKMEQVMYQQFPQQFAITQKLTEIERQLGYLGYIHHFKNYIIRRESYYFYEASSKYQLLMFHLNELQAMIHDPFVLEEIDVLRTTLDEYNQKLTRARERHPTLSVEALDRIVKVDDSAAGQALLAIQNSLAPEVTAIIASSKAQLAQMHRYLWQFNFLLLPVLLATTFFIVRTLKRATYLSQELEQIIDISPDAILYLDDNGKILRTNSRASSLFGYSPHEWHQLVIEDLVTSPLRAKHQEYQQLFQLKSSPLDSGSRFRPIQGVTKDGRKLELNIAITSAMIVDKPRTVCVIKDMRMHNHLKQEAEQDHLTHLYNRRAIDHLLFRELCRSKKTGTDLSILIIDLDNFKAINDELGHAYGDSALIKIADFLRDNTRHYDVLGRWGGDEFILICPNLGVENAITYAQRLIQTFNKMAISEGELGLSIGIATNTKHLRYDKHSLFQAADQALYASKKSGKSRETHINNLEKE